MTADDRTLADDLDLADDLETPTVRDVAIQAADRLRALDAEVERLTARIAMAEDAIGRANARYETSVHEPASFTVATDMYTALSSYSGYLAAHSEDGR